MLGGQGVGPTAGCLQHKEAPLLAFARESGCSAAGKAWRHGDAASDVRQEWTVWRGGYSSTHRHVANPKARWVRGPVVRGCAAEDRQRRNVGLGPLWTGEGKREHFESSSIQLFNAWPKRWGEVESENGELRSTGPALCICHTAIPKGTPELVLGLRNRKRGSATRQSSDVGQADRHAALSSIARGAASEGRGQQLSSGTRCVEQLRESHRELLRAAERAAGSADPGIQERARSTLEGKILEIDSAIAACASLRAKARVMELRRQAALVHK